MNDLPLNRIAFIGAGAIATSLGNALAKNSSNDVTMISIEKDVVSSVNGSHTNTRYFPSISLHPNLKATEDISLLSKADLIFLAIPSSEIVRYLKKNHHLVQPGSVIINLAKGFGENNKTIIDCLSEFMPNPLCSMKGPTFARDIMNNQPTAFTLGSEDSALYQRLSQSFRGTNIYLDHTTDVRGVEILSLLKNIYAIVIGIADANYDSPNLRFMLLTRAFKEMQKILIHFGGRQETMFNYCGFGDFNLTALNDLSRNRTLGLLIGKGFFTHDISDKVILEGRIAVNVFCEEICRTGKRDRFPIIREMYQVFNDEYDVSSFVNRLLSFGEDNFMKG